MWAHLFSEPTRVTHVAKMSGLYVLPTHIGSGLGALLHDRFAGELHRDEEGVLEVWAGNDRAVDF